MRIAFTIYGIAESKANSRKPATVGKPDNRRTIWIKSDKARAFEKDAQLQIPMSARAMLEGPVFVSLRMFYPDERRDMDESLVLDVLQAKFEGTGTERRLIRRGCYLNDRQVRKKLVEHFIDRANPRVEIEIEPMQPQQTALPSVAPVPTKPRKQVHVKHRADITADTTIPF